MILLATISNTLSGGGAMSLQLATLDHLILGTYFIFVIGIGWAIRRHMKTTSSNPAVRFLRGFAHCLLRHQGHARCLEFLVVIALYQKGGSASIALPVGADGNPDCNMVVSAMLTKYFPHGMLGIGLTPLMASFMSGMAGNTHPA